KKLDLELRRHLCLDAGHRRAHPVDHVERGGALAFEHGHKHRAPSVAPDDVGLHGVAVTYMGDIFDVDRYAVDGLDRKLIEGIDQVGTAVELDVVFRVAHF